MTTKMTARRAKELLLIKMACVKRASGLEYDLAEQGWVQTSDICDRDCANCALVQDSEELLEMYNYVGLKMILESCKEEESKSEGLKDWQRECETGPLAALTI